MPMPKPIVIEGKETMEMRNDDFVVGGMYSSSFLIHKILYQKPHFY
jgi:hypothetical protein